MKQVDILNRISKILVSKHLGELHEAIVHELNNSNNVETRVATALKSHLAGRDPKLHEAAMIDFTVDCTVNVEARNEYYKAVYDHMLKAQDQINHDILMDFVSEEDQVELNEKFEAVKNSKELHNIIKTLQEEFKCED